MGWNVKSAQHVGTDLWTHISYGTLNPFKAADLSQMVASGNHKEFEHFIAHARASKHVHPNFIADIETLYRNMTQPCTASIQQAQIETNRHKNHLGLCVDQYIRLETKLHIAQTETRSCQQQITSVKEEHEACEKDKGEALDDLHDWATGEHRKAAMMVKYGRRNE